MWRAPHVVFSPELISVNVANDICGLARLLRSWAEWGGGVRRGRGEDGEKVKGKRKDGRKTKKDESKKRKRKWWDTSRGRQRKGKT